MIKDSSRFTTPFLTLLSSLPFPSSLSARPPTCCTHLDTDRERRGKGGYGQGPPERASESKSAKEDLCTEIRGVAGRAQDARVPQGVVHHYRARSERGARVSANARARKTTEKNQPDMRAFHSICCGALKSGSTLPSSPSLSLAHELSLHSLFTHLPGEAGAKSSGCDMRSS